MVSCILVLHVLYYTRFFRLSLRFFRRGEFELTKQLRSMTIDQGEFASISSPADMFEWLETTLIPALVPGTSTTGMRSTYLHQKNDADRGVNTINGVLKILGGKCF